MAVNIASSSSSSSSSSGSSGSSVQAKPKPGPSGDEKAPSILDTLSENIGIASPARAEDDSAMDVEGPPEGESEGMKKLKESRKKMARRTCCYLTLIPNESSIQVGGKAVNLKTINAKAFLHNKAEELANTIKAAFGARVENLSCSVFDGEKKLDDHQPLLFNAIMRGFAGHTKDNIAFVNEAKLELQLRYSLE